MLLRRLTSGSAMSHGFGAHHLLGRADHYLGHGTGASLVRSSEVSMSAFTFGLIQGKFKKDGGLTLILPVDLLAGAAFHLVGLFGFAKPYANHLHAIGDGALASFFTTTGYRVGERWGQGGSLMHGLSGMFGDKEPAGGSTIADKELANLVKAG